jgi:2-keto-4-pentenoate hydratase/2-oxohepta-3-ene-1,7-dioic acid hydratase in catechol pathway
MKLITFTHEGRTRIGIAAGDEAVDLSTAAPDLPTRMVDFLEQGDAGLDAARRALESGAGRLPLGEVKLEAPVPRPPEFLGVGLNYRDHIEESGMGTPEFLVVFNKQSSCVTGPTDPIHRPRVSTALDYEGELAFVIGKPARTLGKSFETHGPMGPWIVTPDDIGDPHALELRTWVNGEERQHSNTKNLVFDCFDVIETLSTVWTLAPGTVVATGTPGGVGVAMKPPKFLVAGDTVRIEVEGIGWIENRVIEEPA